MGGATVMARFLVLPVVRKTMRHGLAGTGECREHEE